MKIENLKINAFGKLENKEIEFGEHINIVQGNNESGKSTLLKFISSIFYGTSKNKKGKEFSDYEKYKPWNNEEFSGKLAYKLDNEEKYEVFREFGGKKNPKIYNEQLEDVSKKYTIDKTYGNQYFTEQTGVDETIFLSTLVSMQQEVKLDRNVQNTMLQKVANLASTGDDSTSYKKAQEKLSKKQVEEIGTARSQGRPINIIKEEKFKIQDEIGELENYKIRKVEIEKEKEEKVEELKQVEEKLELIQKLKGIEEKEELSKQKIKVNENLQQAQEKRKKELEEENAKAEKEIENIEEQIKGKEPIEQSKYPTLKRNIAICLIIISIILGILSASVIKELTISIIVLAIFLISLIWLVFEIKNKKAFEKKQKEKIEKEEETREKQKTELQNKRAELTKVQAEINILKNNIEQYEKNINEEKQKIELEKKQEIEKIKQEETSNSIIENIIDIKNIQREKERQEQERSNKKLEYNSLELEEKVIAPKLEQMALLEEKLEDLKQKEEDLEKNNEAIEITRKMLESAYLKMKQNVTPKLTQELSKNIQKISNGKYSKINLHEEKGIIIEKENGEYIEAEKLSVRNYRPIIFIIKASNTKRIITRKYANHSR